MTIDDDGHNDYCDRDDHDDYDLMQIDIDNYDKG